MNIYCPNCLRSQWRKADLPTVDGEWKELACDRCPAHFLVDNVGQIKRIPRSAQPQGDDRGSHG